MIAVLDVARHAGYWGMGGWWIWAGMALFWILLFGLVFGFLGRRWRKSHGEHSRWDHSAFAQGGGYPPAGFNAQATLAERFAQGDIDEKEYRARLDVLRANAPGQRS